MNFRTLAAVVEELDSLLTGARVERVSESGERELLIEFRNEGKNYFLLISPDRSLPSMHLISRKRAAGPSASVFMLYLRSRLPGGRVEQISVLNGDRIAAFDLRRQGVYTRLIIELFGPAANLIIVDQSETILAVYYPVPPSDGRKRALIPGLQYQHPEKQAGLLTSREIPSAASTASANQEAEFEYEALLAERKIRSARAAARSAIGRARKKTERMLAALQADRRFSDNAEEYKRNGSLVLAHLHELRSGIEEAELSDFDGTPRRILLDPKRSPAGNAERYFKKYKKAKAATKIVAGRIRAAEEELLLLTHLSDELEQAADGAAVLSLQARLVDQGYILAAPGHKARTPRPGSGLFRKIPCGDWEILVGKNAAGNDFIATRLANPGDIWLHAEGLPGSHVLIRNPENLTVPSEVLERAGSLAAFYSKGRASGKVAVTYTFARFVRKPRGAKPGLVTVAERKTMMAKPRQE